ncbi:MAG: hypothetical protein IKG21_08365 [Atopobiaceae bacterium]|nr:hypothetical protein [Atopobiaceae bacterium]
MKAKSNRVLTVLLVLALCVLPACSGGAGATASGAGDSTAVSSTSGSEGVAGQATPATIAIPGYETIEFAAGKTTQLVDLYNPDRNACDFRMTLVLDGENANDKGKATSEGEVLWTSELVGPGERVGKIELAKSLEAGDYPATLKYECFTLGDGAPLNGSEVKLTLHVV